MDLSGRLNARDYTIAHLLDEHTALTTPQLAAVLFGSPITCQHRLNSLRKLQFVDRFIRNQPTRPRPMCWVAGPLAARYVALSREENPPTPKAVQQRAERIMASPKLDHLLGVNGFFVALAAHARTHPAARLARWWSERSSSAAYGRRVRPDGHGVWTEGTASVGFFVEYDTGTEPIGRLLDKLPAYRQLRDDGGPDYPVLFVLHSPVREQHLHQRLSAGLGTTVTVATTSPQAGSDPAAAVWQVVGDGRRRRLADLPGSHGQTGPINPGPPTAVDDPLRLLQSL
ncbi:replication-relaxation family protein [Catellatospora sp. NPDC049111]|uniref:replication-relaxation family protein n=1 Tax=Catellatospora sp. NPDC049111 TaxID=3155271 RepID=UPI0033FC3CB7